MKVLLSCVVLMALVVGACDKPAKPVKPEMWTRVPLPAGAGASLRDVAICDGHAVVVGGRAGGPVGWRNEETIPFAPLSGSYYGPREQIDSVACAGGRVAMVGAVPGGAHGNPRVSTWRLDGRRMRENAAPFETYGGDEAVDVGRVEGGRTGFAIAGNRTSGAAAWFSTNGQEFRLSEAHQSGRTAARDVVELADGRWMIIGGRATGTSADQQPAAWIEPRWQPADPPTATGYNELQRAVRQGDDIIAAGMRGSRFATWRWHAGTWTAQDTYDGGDPAGVRSLALAGGHVVLVGGDRLWIDGRKQATPAPPIAVAGSGDFLLMVTADGLWRATLS